MSKDHFYFNRNDRIVAIILLSVIIIVNIILNPWNPPGYRKEKMVCLGYGDSAGKECPIHSQEQTS